MIRRTLLIIALIVAALGIYAGAAWLNLLGRLHPAGEIEGAPIPATVKANRATRVLAAARDIRAADSKRILFGDLHVHTTYSIDAFMQAIPLMGGEGAHPPADACDFARYCSAVDFFSITDHAEAMSPRKWRETIASTRQCNAIAGDPANPDVVSFLGWEWTNKDPDRDRHFGHKNVILKDLAENQVPSRPIAAPGMQLDAMTGRGGFLPKTRLLMTMAAMDVGHRQFYYDLMAELSDVTAVPLCPAGVAVRDLPDACREVAYTPAELYSKLDEWGFPAIVIPHGNAWGWTSPPNYSWDNQLSNGNHDPSMQTLIEAYSGHGNSEEYREWRTFEEKPDGTFACPEPSEGYTSECWQAGEIIRERCLADGEDADECERRMLAARQHYVNGGAIGLLAIPGVTPEELLDAGQCTDCYLPAASYRPGGSTQYALAIRNFDDPDEPVGFRFGLIASSDNHKARAGTGYKEIGRRGMADVNGSDDPDNPVTNMLMRRREKRSVSVNVIPGSALGNRTFFERNASFQYTGGLVAVHAVGRDRGSIWDALERREVYGTSGPRILLWFDLLTPGDELPMGSQVVTAQAPRFRVRAVGSFKQKPGCPPHALAGLPERRIENLCFGECYHPSDERHLITRIEVVRIRPQRRPGEPVAALVEDPWQSLSCPPDPAGCSIEFVDPDFPRARRDTVYYVRALQESTPQINAANLRCTYDDTGRCVEVDPCYASYPTPGDDLCLAAAEARAFSSPIFVDYGGR
jgi:hypothetical protein